MALSQLVCSLVASPQHKPLVHVEVKQVWQHCLANKSSVNSVDVAKLIPAVCLVAGAHSGRFVCSRYLMDQESIWSYSYLSCPLWLLGSSVTTQRSFALLLSAAELLLHNAECPCLFVCLFALIFNAALQHKPHHQIAGSLAWGEVFLWRPCKDCLNPNRESCWFYLWASMRSFQEEGKTEMSNAFIKLS